MPTIKEGKLTKKTNISYFSKEFVLKKAHKDDSGYDLYADITSDVILEPGSFKTLDTGVKLALPKDTEGQIRSRSGMASKLGISVLNSPGTIDPGYRGEIKVILINNGTNARVIKRGDKIAQVIFSILSDTATIRVKEEKDLGQETERGTKGFGSTDLKH